MGFFLKALFSGFAIAFAAHLAGRKPAAAGFLIALPLMSMLSILFSYLQYRDMDKINTFAVSIVVGVPLSLSFFLPFVLNRWLKLSFPLTYLAALGCLAGAYLLHGLIFRTGLR